MPDIPDIDGSTEDSDIEPPTYSPISTVSDNSSACGNVAESDQGSGKQGEELMVHDERETAEDIHLESMQTTPTQQPWSGFKMVGDNVDKTIRASFQRSDDHTTRSLHYFHAYAVKDRINFSTLPDSQPQPCKFDLESLLPSQSDIEVIKTEMATLLSRYYL